MSEPRPIVPPAAIGFIGLGAMGLPMAARLKAAGFQLRGADLSADARTRFSDIGPAFAAAREAALGAAALITMLPNGAIVRDALLGDNGAAHALAPATLVIDMSSSAPTDTMALAADLAARGLSLVDAPVSGGVKRAQEGALAIMAGGAAAQVARARALFAAMGKAIFPTGPSGSGHTMKALNNYVSAAGLVAACEALLVARQFGLDADVVVDVLNASTGRNNSTEVKMKPFVISERFNSGFSLALMAKDLRIAANLARHFNLDAREMAFVADLWERAGASLPAGADHTEIYRYIADTARA